MNMIDPILLELEQESKATMRLLERVPDEHLSWRPHPKSMSLGQLALHIAQGPGNVARMAPLDGVDVPKFQQAEATSRQQLLDTFKAGLAEAQAGLSGMDNTTLMGPWQVTSQGKVVLSMPRIGLLRTLMLNHCYHHRGQLTVYLRLLDVPLPSVYGPSADENPM